MTDEQIRACPECDGTNIRRVYADKPVSHARTDHRWRCATCTHRFDDPTERERQSVGGFNKGTVARELQDADPEDVSREAAE